MFSDLKKEVIVGFVDIGRIVAHLTLFQLSVFNNIEQLFDILIVHVVNIRI